MSTTTRTRFFTIGASARVYETNRDGHLYLTNRWTPPGDRLELGAPRKMALGSCEVLVVPNTLPATGRQRWFRVDDLALTSEELATLREMRHEDRGVSRHEKNDLDRLFEQISGRDSIPA